MLFKKSQSRGVIDYTLAAKALSMLDSFLELKLMNKFVIAYLLCKQNLVFTKMAPVCVLEECQGVDLGAGCKNDQSNIA